MLLVLSMLRGLEDFFLRIDPLYTFVQISSLPSRITRVESSGLQWFVELVEDPQFGGPMVWRRFGSLI